MQFQEEQKLRELEQQPDSDDNLDRRRRNPFEKMMSYLKLQTCKKPIKETDAKKKEDSFDNSIRHVEDDDDQDLDLLSECTTS
jgi:hypothetical protein